MTVSSAVPSAQKQKTTIPVGLILGVLTLVVALLLPTPADLPIAGHRMLAILAFAVVVWLTEAVSYEASAIIITTLMAFLLGTAPTIKNPDVLYGTSAAIGMALSGFSNSALALVWAALFLAAAMTFTGLDKRIALLTLSKIGTSPIRIMIGCIAVTILLSLAVPSSTARSAAVVPIMMGVINSFGIDKKSNLAAGIMIIVAQATGIWNIGIKTAAAQNILTSSFMTKLLGESVSWSDWFLAGAPWSLLMSVILIITVLKLLPPENNINTGKESVIKSLNDLGPMSTAQKKLMIISLFLLFFWATEGSLHNFDTTSTTFLGLVVLILPKIGVMSWKDVQSRIPWGTVIVFGIGVSIGTALLTTEAGQWLGRQVVAYTGLDKVAPFNVFAIVTAFLIIIHIGFASATALVSSMLPILISVLASMPGDFSRLGITMFMGFAVSFGFILPINSPQNMVCISTDTFNAKQFAKIGIIITIAGYLLMILFGMTYWHWLGWL
ncbi:Inner membrane protein YbhI [Candidatus Kinetoplastibacterium sorsogonicusi]|uniref:Inner membrane protein YbhI n=1 Tax=Candidatus Kinetoplastidibacterium kentomonadis TaxID=1576550 RepID=A0A3Q8EU04_9PROT|nr:DASS family sodium-coupled anion symporter [Candidatus Kinetoplastibacterium sorsogonicusi]AWD32732.1 Inner membrane protein YbhI [Candidatus Kinetoplastibacterium sorsogonicusi]